MLFFDIDTSDIDRTIRILNPDYSRVEEGLQAVGSFVSGTWQIAALGEKLPGMTRNVNWKEYSDSISYRTDRLAVEIQGDSFKTDSIQSDSQTRDMKPGLLSGPSARTTSRGVRYNIIPFHHNPNNLSQGAINALANDLRGFNTKIGMRSKIVNGQTQMSNNQYVQSGGLRVPANHYTWTTGPESRIRNSGNGPVTFRTVSDKSDPASWWYPGIEANPIVEAVWNMCKNDVEETIIQVWWEALGFAFNPR